jgi:hypothetical protein
MAIQNEVSERRHTERHSVEWPGILTCLFPTHEEDVAVRISEISTTGARLELDSLRIGQYHIVVSSESSEFTLHVKEPGIHMSAPVQIIWYSMDDVKQGFSLGVLFPKVDPIDCTAIENLASGNR